MAENNAREIEEGIYRGIKYATQELEARRRVDEKCGRTVSEKLKPLCGNCLFLVREDGEPFYCVILPFYATRKENDSACEDWRGINNEQVSCKKNDH